MYRVLIILLVATILFSTPGLCQDNQEKPEFEQKVKLDLYLVDFVVIDRNGNYVNGLNAEDFTVYEDGKKVSIVSVDEFVDDSARIPDMAEMPSGEIELPRNIIVVLDRFFSSGYGIKQGKEAISRFIQDNVKENDRVMIMTYDRDFKIQQDFTTSKAQLLASTQDITVASKSLYTPEFTTNNASRADQQMHMGYSGNTSGTDNFSNIRFQQDIRRYFEQLKQLSTALKSVPGKKTVILLSEGYDSRVVNNARGGLDQAQMGGVDVEAEVGVASPEITPTVRPNQNLFLSYGQTLDKINDSSTSFYVIDIASLESQRSRTDLFEERTGSQNSEFDNSRINSLASLASNTGGKLYQNIRNLDRVIDDINYDISNYYILGYRSENTRQQGEFRNIRVESNIDGLEVRHRRGFHEPKNFDQMTEAEQFVQLVEGFFRSSPESDMEGTTSMFFLPIDLETIVGSLAVKIPASELAGDFERTIEFIGQILDNNNGRIDAFHKVIDYSKHVDEINADDELTFKIPFVLKSGSNKVRVIVRDNSTGKRLYHFENYNVVGITPEEISLSSLALIDPDNVNSSVEKHGLTLINRGQDTGYEGYRVIDPLRATMGQPLFPVMKPVFKPESTIIAFFSAANYWQDEQTNAVNFFMDYVLIDEEGKEHSIAVGQERFIPVPGTRRINVLSELQFSGIKPGNYDLVVRFLDRELLQGVKRTLSLTIQ